MGHRSPCDRRRALVGPMRAEQNGELAGVIFNKGIYRGSYIEVLSPPQNLRRSISLGASSGITCGSASPVLLGVCSKSCIRRR